MSAPRQNETRRIAEERGEAQASALARIEAFAAEAARAKAADILFAASQELKRSVAAFHKSDFGEAALRAAAAAEIDPSSGTAYHLLALSLDNLGQMLPAIQMYEKALQLQPGDPDIALNVGLAAWKLDLLSVAERAFRVYIELRPDCPKGYTNLGCCLRDMDRIDDAIDIVRNAIYRIPDQPLLWNALGTIMGEASDFANAVTFYEEAIRLSPDTDRYWHNLAYALNHIALLDRALAAYDRALELNEKRTGGAGDRAEMLHARGLCAVAMGALTPGWSQYEARHDPHFGQSVAYAVAQPRWSGEPLKGKKLLLIGEQGVGDEIMFAEMIPDLIEACGPDGKLMIACDNRLVPLMQRSFPAAHVGPQYNGKRGLKVFRAVPWAKDELTPDFYAPGGTPLQFLRPSRESFGRNGAFLRPDPKDVETWRARLDALGSGPKIGVCWRSGFLNVNRQKHYAPLETWAETLRPVKACFVNLQYGDCAAELAELRDKYGVTVSAFEDLDLKNDFSGNAALCAALDLAVCAPNAGAALAAAVGTETWFVVGAHGWPQFGLDHYPWYPKTRAFSSRAFADWRESLGHVRAALTERFG